MADEAHIHGVVLRPDDLIEINYMEIRDQSDQVGLIKTLIVEKEAIPDEANEMVEAIREVVDAGLRLLREG